MQKTRSIASVRGSSLVTARSSPLSLLGSTVISPAPLNRCQPDYKTAAEEREEFHVVLAGSLLFFLRYLFGRTCVRRTRFVFHAKNLISLNRTITGEKYAGSVLSSPLLSRAEIRVR